VTDTRVSLPAFEMRPEVQAAYDHFVQAHHGEIEVPLLAETMFNAGGRATTRALVQFGDLLPLMNKIDQRIHQILGLVEGMADADIEREIEDGSPAWHTDTESV
jgi:hypothetical protein